MFFTAVCVLFFLCQISISVCRRDTLVLNYYSTKFHEILTSSSVEISAFPLNHAVTIFWLTAYALHLRGFSIFLDPYKQSQKGRVFSNSITFNTLKNKGFSHITNCLIVETEKRPLAQSSLKTTEKMRFEYRRHVCFS